NEKHPEPYGLQVVNRIGENVEDHITITEISIPPMDHLMELKRDEAFSHFYIDKHRQLAGDLTSIFMGLRNTDDLMSVASYAREHINPQMFSYSFSVALLHRPDTKELNIPSVVHSFPDKFVENKLTGQARGREEEHRLFCFREDIGVNLHHWHWHQVYPGQGPENVVKKDRRGELFYYMHQQLSPAARKSSKARRRREDWKAPIKEAYFPKLDRLVSKGLTCKIGKFTIEKPQQSYRRIRVDVQALERWRSAIFDAIDTLEVKDVSMIYPKTTDQVALDEFTGIDILGNLIESTSLSINPNAYVNLHNQGHN
ncbi:hypothetical protein NQ317_009310, partial [Molorchus minor]